MRLNGHAAVRLYATDIKISVQDAGHDVAAERVVIVQHGGQVIVRIVAVDRRLNGGRGAGRRPSGTAVCARVVIVVGQEIA